MQFQLKDLEYKCVMEKLSLFFLSIVKSKYNHKWISTTMYNKQNNKGYNESFHLRMLVLQLQCKNQLTYIFYPQFVENMKFSHFC